ncbi:MAG: hypothetical protein AAFQ95_23980 [Cyanobacteria bacterium J06621_3]
MKIAQPLAEHLLKNIAMAYVEPRLHIGQPPPDLPFTLPAIANSMTIASVDEGRREYNILQSAPASVGDIHIFYLNSLRLGDWLSVRDLQERGYDDYGFIRESRKPSSSLQMIQFSLDLRLSLQFVKSDDERTTYLISIEPLRARTRDLDRTLSGVVKWTPTPALLPLPESRMWRGHKGGTEAYSYEFRLLEHERSVSEVFAHYQSQIEHLAWDLEESQVADQVAYARWTFTDGSRQSWQLFFSIASSQVPNRYSVALYVDRIPVDRRPRYALPEANQVPVSLVKKLLQAQQPNVELSIGQLPEHLQDISLPTGADVSAVIEDKQTFQRLLINMSGSPTAVIEKVNQHFQQIGWVSASSVYPEISGFRDTGYQPMFRDVFYHPEQTYNRLRVWTKPMTKDIVHVDLLFDVDPKKAFSRAFDPSDCAESTEPPSPWLDLMPEQDMLTYLGMGRGGPDSITSSVVVLDVSDTDALMTHYGEQLVAAGWRQFAASPTENLSAISSWGLEVEDGRQWQGLLWIMPGGHNVSEQMVCFDASVPLRPLNAR